jgi:hypothetical protein
VAVFLLAGLALLSSVCSTNQQQAAHQLTQHQASPAATPTPTVGISSSSLVSPTVKASALGSPTSRVALVSTDLDFGGSLSGRVRGSQARGSCARLPDTFSVSLEFTIGGQPLVLEIVIFNYRSPGEFAIPPERVSIHTSTGVTVSRFLPALNGKVSVNVGEQAGSIQATLAESSGSTTTVSGTWACY